jgi:hypothetical protein
MSNRVRLQIKFIYLYFIIKLPVFSLAILFRRISLESTRFLPWEKSIPS